MRQFVLLVIVVAIAGCGPTDPPLPKVVPVRGVVTADGKPARGVRVTFHPRFDVGPRKFAPSAVTGADGAFRLSSASVDDGAPAGDYSVTFVKPLPRNAEEGEPERDAFGGRYADPDSTPYKATVADGPNDLPPFALK